MPRVEDFSVVSSRDGSTIAGVLYMPENVKPPEEGISALPDARAIPAIIMCGGIGTINTKIGHLRPYANIFTAQGYAAVTFDYLTWGNSGGQPRQMVSVSGQLQDVKDILAWVRNQPRRFDRSKLVVWGTSFGAMYVTTLISEDHDLAAGCVQSPFVDGLRGSLKVGPTRVVKLGVSGISDVLLGFRKPKYIALASDGGPGSPSAIMMGMDVIEGWKRTYPQYEGLDRYPNYVGGRIGPQLIFHRPVLHIHKSTKPFLVVLPEYDSLTSIPAAQEAAKNAPLGEAVQVKGGHFDVYEGGLGYEENIKAQLRFFNRVFVASREPSFVTAASVHSKVG